MTKGGRLNAWWAQGPSRRGALLFLSALGGALAVRWLIAAAMFSHELGYLPFDLQGRLNQGMLVIQVGAARGHPLGRLYGAFVMTDIPVSLVIAFTTVVLWRWLHLRAPNPFFGFLTRGGIMLLPVAVAAFELAEHHAVLGLLQQRGREGYAGAVEFVVQVHNVKVVLGAVRDVLTLVFIAATAVLMLRRRETRASPE